MARTGCIFGESGTFKSSQIKFLARYIYRKYGKITRLVSADLGGYAPCQPEIDAGLIEPFRVSTIDAFFPVMRKVAKGYWPTVQGGKATLATPNTGTWDKVGAYAVEGWTSIGDAYMRQLINAGRKISEEVVGQWIEKVNVDGADQEEKFGAAAKSHFLAVQNEIYNLIQAFSSLPCEYVLFTALEAKSEEEDRTTVYGPAIAGKKATVKAPAWVGDLIHHDSVQVAKQVPVLVDGKPSIRDGKPVTETFYETQVRAYFVRHPDPKTNINYPAKPRVPPERWLELMKKWPQGYYSPTLDHGIDLLLELEDELTAGSADALRKWRQDVDAEREKLKGNSAVKI